MTKLEETRENRTDADSALQNVKHVCKSMIGVLAASLFSGALACIVIFEVDKFANVKECGPVECTQLALLFVTSALFAWRAVGKRDETPLAFAVCSLIVLSMAVRELDGPLDKLLWHGSWAVFDAVVAVAICAVIAISPTQSAHDLRLFCESRRFPLFVAGFATAVVFSQLIGWKGIWNQVFNLPFWTDLANTALDETGRLPAPLDIPRHVKNTAEESFELASYTLLFMSAMLPAPRASTRP